MAVGSQCLKEVAKDERPFAIVNDVAELHLSRVATVGKMDLDLRSRCLSLDGGLGEEVMLSEIDSVLLDRCGTASCPNLAKDWAISPGDCETACSRIGSGQMLPVNRSNLDVFVCIRERHRYFHLSRPQWNICQKGTLKRVARGALQIKPTVSTNQDCARAQESIQSSHRARMILYYTLSSS